MADISTAVSMARVPILGEDGRISDDYVPAAIGEGVESAEAAAKRAETAATNAKGSASAASQSATQASGSASAASASATKAQESATSAGGAATSAKSAQTAAEAAKAAAETAQSAAAGSAQDAQQSAAAAADSAASVADKFIASAQATTLEPGSQATASVADQVLTLGIPRGDKGDKGDQGDKGDPGDVSAVTTAEGSDLSVSTAEGTVTIDDSALRARIAELENQAANVVTGTSTGLVSHGEDAFPQKPREVRIKGKTWVNRWPVISGTGNGMTVSTDDTGLITVSGTSTKRVGFTSYVYSVAANKSVTVKISSSIPGVSINVQSYANGEFIANIANVGSNYGNKTEATGVVSSNATRLVCEISISAGTTVNASFRVMLVDGTEAPDCFTPPASITSAQPENLVTSGKNLLSCTGMSQSGSVNGIEFTNNGDGTFSATGTATSTSSLIIASASDISRVLIAGETYVMSLDNATYDNATANISIGFGGGRSFVADETPFVVSASDVANINAVILCVESGNSVDLQNVSVQIELGSTATSYEPPTVTETHLPDVELRSLPNGTCDELVIKADGTCEVERRTGYIASYTDEEVNGEYVSTGNGLEAGASIVYELDEPTTEPQSPVTLPALPAPTFNQYHDASVPSDTSTEYARDINIVLDNLAKQVAGTASAVAVREASTIE